MTPAFIDTPAALADLCRSVQDAPFLALDTEFIRERTYYPQLALIQLGTPALAACIDPVAIPDLTPLWALLCQPQPVKVLHAAGQDMELFFHRFGALPWAVFDTQIAATLLGFGEQVGYAALVKDMLGVELDKSQVRTNWLQRPLTQAQIRYAADDVRYLAQIYPRMLERLTALGRLDWLEEDFVELTDPKRYTPDPANAWRRLKGLNKLRPNQLAVLREVAAWREQEAMRRDLPRRHVLADELLIDIARLRPRDAEGLAGLRGMPTGVVNSQGPALLAAIGRGIDAARDTWPTLPSLRPLTDAEEALGDAIMAVIRLCAAKHGISPAMLASRKEVEQLVRGERDLPLLSGWRRHHGGEQALAFLDGGTALHAEAGHLEIMPTGDHP